MRSHFLVALGVALSISVSISAWAEVKTGTKADPCDQRLPKSLKEVLHKAYPDYRVVSLSMLTVVGQRIYSRDSKSGCPGVAKVRFFDKNKVDYAIAITKRAEPQEISNVLVAKKGQNALWALTILAIDVQGAPPAVLALPPDKYTGYIDESASRTLDSQNEAIFVVYYESSSLVYAVTERGIEKVWLSD